jgi:hypothetical protein
MMIVGARTSSTCARCSAEREGSWRAPARRGAADADERVVASCGARHSLHIGDSIDGDVTGARAADIEAMLVARNAAPALAASRTVPWLDGLWPSHGDA